MVGKKPTSSLLVPSGLRMAWFRPASSPPSPAGAISASKPQRPGPPLADKRPLVPRPRGRRTFHLEILPQPRPRQGCSLKAGMETQGPSGKNAGVHTKPSVHVVWLVGVKIITGYHLKRSLLPLSLVRAHHSLVHVCTFTCTLRHAHAGPTVLHSRTVFGWTACTM